MMKYQNLTGGLIELIRGAGRCLNRPGAERNLIERIRVKNL